MKSVCCALALGLLFPCLAFAQSAQPAVDTSRYFPIEEVRPGLKGYGITVFQGNKPERFDVEILGVIDGQPNPRQKIIIGRLSGGQVDRTRVFAGMSGSPVYVDGRMVGAIAYSFAFATEAIAGITPIGQMIGQLKDAPGTTTHASTSNVSFKDLVSTRQSANVTLPKFLDRVNAPTAVPGTSLVSASPQLAAYASQSLRPIATPLAFTGVPQSVIDMFAPEFERVGLVAVAGSGSGAPLAPLVPSTEDTLAPGSSILVSLIRGDFSAGAAGTVTERTGDRIYAFGHPFLSLGATAMPMSESNVIVVVPNLNNSFKFATATSTVGAIRQDRSSGIGGQLGREAKMVPVRVNFKNSHGETNVYKYEVIDDPTLTPLFLSITLVSTIMGTERQIGDQTIELRGNVRLAGQPSMGFENRFAGSSNAAVAAALSVSQPLQIVMNSGFRDISVEGIDVDITATEDKNMGSLTRVWVDKTRVARGETVEVQAFARTDDGDEYVERIPVTIPTDAPIGRLAIVVGDGATMVATDETLAGFAPENLKQLVAAINKLKKNDRLYVKLVRATGGAVVQNQALTALPPSVLASLGSPRTTSAVTPLQTTTLFERELPPARFIISGQQVLGITVVR